MQRRNIRYLITYADNFALGYFKKQGFSTDYRLTAQKWKGCIKDYEGGTMMQCSIHQRVDYTKIGELIKKQKEFVINKIRELSTNAKQLSGQKLNRCSKQQPLKRVNSLGVEQQFKIDPMKIPGVRQSGWSWQQHEDLLRANDITFALQCQKIIKEMLRHTSSWPFRTPVSEQEVPDYYSIVKEPIDLQTIRRKLQNNHYKDKGQFCNDVNRIFINCRIYNQPETTYCRCANELQEFMRPILEGFIQGNYNFSNGEHVRANKRKKLLS